MRSAESGPRIGWKPKSADPAIASVRFRCLTPMAALQETGLDVSLYDEAKRDAYSLVIFSKLYDRRNQDLARALKARGCRTMLDLSDNHFYNPYDLTAYGAAARDLRVMAGLADLVVCCSEELARVVVAETSLPYAPPIVGDAVEAFDVSARDAGDGVFRMLWFGSHGSPNAPAGMEDLLRIRANVDAAARTRPCELVIVSNNEAKFRVLTDSFVAPLRYVEWSAAGFAAELGRANVVLIPATPNPFTACKSNNRAATALWHGAPVLADPVPAYEELAAFLYLDDWAEGFSDALAGAPAMANRTREGQKYVRARLTPQENARAWRAAIDAALAPGAGDERRHGLSG